MANNPSAVTILAGPNYAVGAVSSDATPTIAETNDSGHDPTSSLSVETWRRAHHDSTAHQQVGAFYSGRIPLTHSKFVAR
jgi:hypothetical protein